MAIQERIEIIITERGARVVQRSLKDVGASAKAAGNDVQFLQQALAVFGGTQLLKSVVGVSDAFTNMQNRIRLVTEGTEQLSAVTEELLGISNRTRTSIATNAELFNRFALATRELGLTQGRVLRIIETVNKATLISGASAKEANNGLIQLSQGLASGALRGDELRSVLEQLPAVADILATQLGVTRGQLRAVGADFKITSDVMVAGLENAAFSIDQRFGKVVPTVEQAFVVLGNSITIALGKFFAGNGIIRSFSEAIVNLAQDVEFVGDVVISGIFTGAIIGATAAIKLLTAAIAANPMAALFVAITSVTAAFFTFSDSIMTGTDNLTTLGDVFVVTFQAIIQSVSNAFFVIGQFFGGLGDGVTDTAVNLDIIIRTFAKFADLVVGIFEGIGNAIASFVKQWASMIIKFLNSMIRNVNEAIGYVVAAFKATEAVITGGDFGEVFLREFEANNDTLKELVNPYETFGEDIGTAFMRGLGRTNIQDAVADLLKAAGDRARERAFKELVAPPDLMNTPIATPEGTKTGLPGLLSAQATKDLIEETKLLQLSNREREVQANLIKFIEQLRKEGVQLTPEEAKLAEQLIRANQEYALRAEILEDIRGPQEEFNAQVASLNYLLDSGTISAEEYSDKLRELKIQALDTATDFTSGFERGIEKVNQDFDDFATEAENLVVDAVGGMKDALVDFVDTGKFSFNDLIQSILHDLAELASSALLDSILGELTGGKLGGQASETNWVGELISGIGSIFGGGKQAGGPVTSNKAFMVGEAGPELFVPPSSGTIVPNAQVTAPGEPPAITIINVMDPDEIHAALSTPRGERTIVNAIQRNRQAVKGAIA